MSFFTIYLSRIPLPWISESPFLETFFEGEGPPSQEESEPLTLELPFALSHGGDYLEDLLQIDPTLHTPYLDVATWMLHYEEVAKLFDYWNMRRSSPLEYVRPGDYRDWRDASRRLGVPLRGLQKIAFGWAGQGQGQGVDSAWSAYVESLEASDVAWLQWYHGEAWRPLFHQITSIYDAFTPKQATVELVAYLDKTYPATATSFGPRFCEGLIQYRNREILMVPAYLQRIRSAIHPETLFQIAFRRNLTSGERREEQCSYLQFLIELGFTFHQDVTYITETFKSKNVLIWDLFHRLYPQKFQYNMIQLYHTLQELCSSRATEGISLAEKQEMVTWIRTHYREWWDDMMRTHTQSLFLPIFMADYYGKPMPLDDDFMEYLFTETGSTASPMYYIYNVILHKVPITEEEMGHFQWKEEWHTIQYPAFRLAIHYDHLPTVEYMVKHHYYSDTDDAKYAILWAVPRRDIFRFLWRHYFRYQYSLFHGEENHRYKNNIYYYLYEAKQLENIHFLYDRKVKPPTDFLRFVRGEKVHMDFYLEHAMDSNSEEITKMREEALFIERVLTILG